MLRANFHPWYHLISWKNSMHLAGTDIISLDLTISIPLPCNAGIYVKLY